MNAGAEGARTIERPESAYVWGSFDAARQLYEMAGADEAKVDEMASAAADIRDSILNRMWSPDMRMFLAGTSYGALSGPSSNGRPTRCPGRRARPDPGEGVEPLRHLRPGPHPQDQWQTYVDGYRFLTYGDNFPIFPFYTANQYDRAGTGSVAATTSPTSTSPLNTVGSGRPCGTTTRSRSTSPRRTRAAPRLDGVEHLPERRRARREPGRVLLAMEPDEPDLPAQQPVPRDARKHELHLRRRHGGLQPRSDDKIELWPIDLGYPHFMVNNLRYHGRT